MALGAGVWLFRASRPAPAPVAQWAVAGRRDVAKTVAATGSVRLKTGSTVRIGAQLSGIVQQLNVTVGSRVKQGDVIAEIDARPVQAKIEQAKAQVVRNEVLLAKAQADLRRISTLADQGWVSRQQLDDTRSAAAGAEATLAAAKEDLKAAGVDLNYVNIRAPISGVVASVSTQRGETVAASFSTPTFVTIIQPDALEVVALVDEADVGDVKIGQAAEFTVESWPDRTFQGQVVRIAPVATVISGVINYEVAVHIDGEVSALRPDMTANVTITTARRTVVTVPAAALRRTPDGTMVTVRAAGGGPPVLRRVRADQTRGGMADITGGLAAGEQVLVETGVRK
ncbi:efflux RND transporter periplasmic adaptor subunit [Phenylobacterium sp.]|uniref:efflux RND transporter periplasmic adaptor subunit n=1 Tax=Phenylobacterium sp. TaxID=1871053 RepID=UPI00356B29C5